MPVSVNGTIVKQKQVGKSLEINDDIPLLDYDTLDNLQDDLNYLRSVLKNLKGTTNYNSPVTRTLESIASELQAAVFNDVTITGNSIADTPVLSDYSQRIATTEYVTDKIEQKISESRYTHTQNQVSAVWEINHNLNRTPSVTVVDSGGTVVVGNIIYVNENKINVEFSSPFSGKAYLN